MNKDERLDLYLNLLQPSLPDWLSEIENSALKEKVPIIRKSVQHFFRWLLRVHKPKKILELGAGVGFSALFFAEYSDKDTKIFTVENSNQRIKEAKINIKNSPYEEKVNLIEGDALIKIQEFNEYFDMIFLDSSKGHYISILPDIKKRMKSGNVLIADNILQDMTVIESTFSIKRRNRTIHKRMREFLEVISKDNDFVTSTVPLGDGIILAVKK